MLLWVCAVLRSKARKLTLVSSFWIEGRNRGSEIEKIFLFLYLPEENKVSIRINKRSRFFGWVTLVYSVTIFHLTVKFSLGMTWQDNRDFVPFSFVWLGHASFHHSAMHASSIAFIFFQWSLRLTQIVMAVVFSLLLHGFFRAVFLSILGMLDHLTF